MKALRSIPIGALLILVCMLETGCGTLTNAFVEGAFATWDVNSKRAAYERKGFSKPEASRRASEDQLFEDIEKK